MKEIEKLKKTAILIWLSIFIFSVLADQISKYWARHNLPFDESLIFVKHILNWHLVFNTGAAFSFLSGQVQVLSLISFVFSIFLLFYSWQIINQDKNLFNTISLALISGGAIGNLIDRLYFKQVTDFIDLLILPGNFPIFNLADSFINIGAFLFLLNLIIYERPFDKLQT